MEGQVIELAYALDTFYFLVMGAFVMWMAAGFSMLEAGMVSSKSVVEILTKNIALYSIASIMYMIVGYNLMYPADGNGVMPAVSFFLGGDNEAADVIASGGDVYYSALSDFFFQVVFVATAMSIVSGAVAERMKLSSFLLFAIVMTGLIYPVQGYWKWGGGFLDAAGFQDFAGSGVVHLCGAAAALAGCILLGARKGKYEDGKINAIPGSNMPLATLGTFILWLGWFGFNGGSQLAIGTFDDAVAVSSIFINTNLAACGGVMAAATITRLMYGKTDVVQMLNGAIGGLVAVTAEPLAPTPLAAIFIGAIGGLIVVFGTKLLFSFKLDDVVGAIPAHMFAGIWGTLAVPLTNTDANFSAQIIGVLSINIFVFVVSYIVFSVMKATFGIRLSKEAESKGTDVTETGVIAYAIRD